MEAHLRLAESARLPDLLSQSRQRGDRQLQPLDYIDLDPSRRITDLQKLAAIIVPDSEFAGDSVFWKDSARNLTASLLSFLVECPDTRPTLGELYRVLGSVGDEQEAIRRLLATYADISPKRL